MELAEQKAMNIQKMVTARRAVALTVLVAATVGVTSSGRAQSSGEKREVKHRVTPNVPELARKLNLSGTVRVEITIAPDGSVKRTRIVGGHPVLAIEAERAAQKSTFEPAAKETIEII